MINNTNKPILILVDGSSYLFRAYYALPPLTNSQGQATGAILGVINMLKKLVKTYDPKLMVITFDSKHPTFRHKLFAEYKANRSQMPEELAQQISPLLEIIEALGFFVLQVPGLEADDMIGTLAVKAQKQGMFSIISTGDKDLVQLVNDDIIIVNTMTDLTLDPKGAIEKFKIPPELIVDYLVLTGDQVDNIPGVAGVGPKTAIKWLEKYKNLENIIKHSNEITGKVGENLRAAIDKFPLYRELVTIDTNLNLNVDFADLIIKPKNIEQLKYLFTKLEINSWLKDLKTEDTKNHNIKLDIENNNITPDLNYWLKKLESVDLFSVHLQTTTTDPICAEITGIYLATPDDSCYIASIELDFLNKLAVILTNQQKTKVFYNLKYIAQVLTNYSINIAPPFFDVALESYVINSLVKLNLELTTPLAAKNILALHNDFWPKICKLPKLQEVLVNIELPLIMVLKTMERCGVLIDLKKLSEQGVVLKERLIILENTAYQLAGETFNLNSPKQMQEIFYTKLGLPILQKTPTGQASTSEQVLQELALEFELPKIILEYRTLSKLQSTYVEKLPKNINPVTNRIHTSYNQTVTATGRLSSTEPNLQNIPIRTKEGRSIREAFIARSGYKILSADYSQIELRILAHLSMDPGLIRGFSENLDIHTITASEVFHVAFNEVTEDLRRKAKAINFGLMYGMSDFGLAKQLKISRQEAEMYIKIYFAKFPKVQGFMESTRHMAAKNGFVETIFGRRLYLPDITSKNGNRRKAAERAAINAPMQGTQADLIKIAMINLDRWIQQQAPDLFMLMQVHDELVFEVPENKLVMAKENIINIMSNVAQLAVNLQVEVGIGNNWAEAH